MDYSLRPCAPGDEEALALVGRATFLETFAGILDGADILAHCRDQHAPAVYAAWLRSPTAAIWLAEAVEGRAPVGYVVIDAPKLPVPDPRPDDVEIKRIYVLHRFQGAGVGRALMERALAAARERGSRRALLGVYAQNARAIAFYLRHGFRQVGERRFTVGHNTYGDLVLARELAGA